MKRSTASKLLEGHSAAPDQALIKNARSNYERLGAGEQFALAIQLASCRRADITQRFRTVIHVVAGMRRRTTSDGESLLRNAPCIIFMVRRKQDEASLRPTQRLPSELLTPVSVDGQMLICAVPTDVQQESRFLGARAQAATAVHSVPNTGTADWGSLTCAVKTANGDIFCMAPAHVLSPYPPLDGQGIAQQGVKQFRVTRIQTPTDTAPCLESTSFGGRLAPYPTTSFDVQFARITDPSRAQIAFAGIQWSANHPIANDILDLHALLHPDLRLEILVPSNHVNRLSDSDPIVLLASISSYCQNCPLTYIFESPGNQQLVLHSALEIQLEPGHAVQGGDSGCPVVVPVDDGYVFAGMVFAGNARAQTAWMIPSWELFDPERYAVVDGSMPSDSMTLFNL